MFYHSVVEKPLIENPHYPSELVNAAVHMIQNHAGLPHFNVQYLAKRIQCSPNYLSALFSKEVGQTISQYLLQTRLGMAKQLFNSSEKSVAQIAQTCGFSSTSYFIAQFKRMEGCTPKAYRVSQYSSMWWGAAIRFWAMPSSLFFSNKGLDRMRWQGKSRFSILYTGSSS